MNRIHQKHEGAIILNAVMILSIAILVIGFSNAYFDRQVRSYQKLDEIYKQEITNNAESTEQLKFWEALQPLN
ncbi:hypothetical protein M5C72_04425 [Companilactobacillus allii]|uniref:Uncharacterized protein n=1 Tax=Companilactobacillus allii TaxID=1847728 RepID=A0A1P8Q3G3_9LACO|nr:hypothetical protein [Companilactobacillus allii]APX72390.1 hypothetical protein BTM29_07365 [Companilactobacillus allii]USQ69482.1 hypothetical protein M5C72_04425 [Companilactobacillus allii]